MFVYDERIAITHDVETNNVILWTAQEYPGGNGKLRVFRDEEGAAVLQSDDGDWWLSNRKEAPYCFYAQLWLGDFPYGSWAICIRLCKETGDFKIITVETDINPRGQSQSDRWRDTCRAYIPKGIVEAIPLEA